MNRIVETHRTKLWKKNPRKLLSKEATHVHFWIDQPATFRMSTYEEEHNIVDQPAHQSTEHRNHQTLTNLLNQFFEGSSSFTDTTLTPEANQIEDFIRAINAFGGIPLRDALIEQLHTEKDIEGVSQEYIDSLERVPKKSLKKDQTCSICTNDFLDDPHPLVVRLPCDGNHKFDLECIAPWLKVHSTCPLCRKDLLAKKKFTDLPEDDEEEEEDWEMFG